MFYQLLRNSTVLALIVLSFSSFAQDALFSTLVTNGYVVVQRGGDADEYEDLKFGVKLYQGDKIVTTGGEVYIGLISSNGQLVELTEGPIFDVSTIAANLSQENSASEETGYLDLLESTFGESSTQGKNNTQRAVNKEEIDWRIPTDSKVLGNTITVRWSESNSESYTLKVLDMFDEAVYTTQVLQNEFELDLASLNLVNDDVYQIQVIDANNPEVNSSKLTIRVPALEMAEKHRTVLNGFNSESAIHHAIMASYFEKNEFYLRAMMHYEKAASLKPNVTAYQDMYSQYKMRMQFD